MKKKKILSLALAVTMLFGSAAALPEGAFNEFASVSASAEINEYNATNDVFEYDLKFDQLCLGGPNRYDTSIIIANQIKKLNGNKKFKNIIIASGTGFSGALSSAYLSKVKDAPILIVGPGVTDKIVNYVKSNALESATVFIIGGESSVSSTVEKSLKQSFRDVKRLWGKDRIETNLAVLRESGNKENEIIIGNGLGYADNLSASATGKPILLTMGDGLTDNQKEYLRNSNFKYATIIGENDVVSDGVESDVRKLVDNVERQGGRTRFETSLLIAKKYFNNPKTISIAYGLNYPDGLCGASLSMKYGCPLILTTSKTIDPVMEYAKSNGVKSLVIYGEDDYLWTDPIYTWSKDNAFCAATRSYSINPNRIETEKVKTVYTVTKKPSPESTGIGTFTAVFSNKFFSKQTKNITIPKTKAVSISGAVIHGPQSSYTYTGKAIAPAVWVELNGKTLTKGTDYTVTYKNNIKVGTATIVVTGKGSYTGSVTKTFKIVAKTSPASSFTWGKDNWNFNNSDYYPGYFSSGTYRSQINSTYLNVLKKNLTNSEYQVVFVGSWFSGAWLDDRWGGSCYGMSSTALLAKKGLLPYSSYGKGATKLHDLTWPTKSNNISSLITYYQMLQVKDIIQQQYRTVPNKTNKENISKIISLLNSNSTVLVGFEKSGWGGHAILAYGYEYGSWTKNSITYQGRIKICDPNSSIQNNENCYIYFNTKSYNWAIPFYSGITSSYGAVFNYVGANVSEINQGGYLSGKSSTKASEYIARLDAMSISDNRSVTKVKNVNGTYIKQNNAPGDIVEAYSYILGGEAKGTIGYNLHDSNSAYKVTQSDPVELQLSIKYQDCRLSGGSAAGNSVIFDKNGFVSVNGESARFNISMTHDINFPTDWFTVQVKGDNTNDASLKKVNNGWVVSADRLQNVEVAVNNKEDSAHVKFSSKYKSALIYEINKKTIGIAVDTDNNGTYETKVKTEDMTQTRLAGANRYETAAVISEDMYKNGTDTVIIATGLDFHDAMVAVPLASAYDAPLLLTTDKQVTKQTEAELKRLKAKKVIIVSTNGAVGSAVKAALAKYNPTMISGKNCFETAAKVAKALQAKTKKTPDTIFFATDSAFADALSASPVAAIKNAPIIYLKNKGSIDSATANYLKSVKGKVKNAYVIGGDGVISDAMMKNVATALGLKVGSSVQRVAGKNRYETCVAVNNKFKSVLSSDGICVAKGLDFPDALAGGVYAAKTKQALFLADGKKLQDVQISYLKGKNASKITVFGGTGAVPDDLVKLIAKASV